MDMRDARSTKGPHMNTTVSSGSEPLRFTGSGAEYFGIWIVNLLLTLVTIGIYSAWAKVRRLQYFYRHTEVAGSSFDFHGSPTKILIGRVVAVLLLVVYNYSVRLHSPLTLFVLIGLAVIMPWLLRNSLRFRLYNTSWRGTRFHFRGTTAGSYRVFLLNGFLALITLYAMLPFAHQRLKAYQHDNSWFGRTRCSFHARAGSFYAIYLGVLGVVALVVGACLALGVGRAIAGYLKLKAEHGHIDPLAMIRTVGVLYLVVALLAVSVGPLFHALITNLIWSNTRLGEHRIECRMSPPRLIWITLSNFVLVVLTLGLYIPFASVRLARFQLEAISVKTAGELQFEAAEPEAIGAVGEEAATAFDFDISL
jgi:uncharacterized membrane protein YjgN (DUF898 family)